MNNSKKINVSYSSLVGLKAELLRKQAEVEELKAKNKLKAPISKPKVKHKSPNNSKVKEEKGEKNSTEIEDVNELKKSRYMLEAKAKLYEKLKRTHGDKSHNYLVDFSNKPISSSSSSEDEIYREEDYEDNNSDPEEDWVEYQDCFGRTRKCLRRDLPRMQEKDNLIKQEIRKDPPEESEPPPKTSQFIPPEKEPEIEKLRKKWEEQSEKLSHKPDIHYQDILFDEARTHGVGYYGFSQDEEERLKQQENLTKLRKETEQRQKEMEQIKDLKNKMEQNRLKAARIRQRIRAGLPAESDDEECAKSPKKPEETSETSVESNQQSNEEKVAEEAEEAAKNPEKDGENSLAVIEDKIKAFGELLGKRPKLRELSQEEWIHKRRKDRLGEFAPVYDNFQPGGVLRGTDDSQVANAEDADPLRIRVGGPEPTDIWETQRINRAEKERNDKGNLNESNCLPASNTVGPVPPPAFVPPGPLPSNRSGISPFPVGNILSNSNEVPSIPPIEILRAVPPPTFHPAAGTVSATFAGAEGDANEEDGESDESSDSEIIGPMPPTTVNTNYITEIPLPQQPPPIPAKTNLNLEKISEGLKYLRKKFDSCDNT